MRPVVTVAEMAAFDAAALQTVPKDELTERAGSAVATAIVRRFGPVGSKRISVVAGSGSNGADGRVAARILGEAGAQISMLKPDATDGDLVGSDIVIDAAFGTGLSRSYEAPNPPMTASVVAVDLPSGLDGDTGEVAGRAMTADLTVTMAATKAGLLLGHGADLSGVIEVADIGIGVDGADQALLTSEDLDRWPLRSRTSHKWSAAVTVVAGGPGMEGAGALSSLGALRSGAGMVRLIHPVSSMSTAVAWPLELVRRPTSFEALAAVCLEESDRSGALVIGPGLGTTPAAHQAVRSLLAERRCPVILDADGLGAVDGVDGLAELVAAQSSAVVVTPHDGELRRLTGQVVPPSDRMAAARELARRTGATVLLKGSTTVVASPSVVTPSVLLIDAGTEALATAGTGDVLSGVIAALLALGCEASMAAGLGALVHGLAGARSSGVLIASELPALIGEIVGEVRRGR